MSFSSAEGREQEGCVASFSGVSTSSTLYSVHKLLQAWTKAEDCTSLTPKAKDIGILKPQVESLASYSK